jgi:equilibrative nucleoside transporter 1/2/3
MDRNAESPSHGIEKGYERLLGSEDMEAKYEDRSEAVKGHTRQFSLSEYCGFFAIGLSMMWTW